MSNVYNVYCTCNDVVMDQNINHFITYVNLGVCPQGYLKIFWDVEDILGCLRIPWPIRIYTEIMWVNIQKDILWWNPWFIPRYPIYPIYSSISNIPYDIHLSFPDVSFHIEGDSTFFLENSKFFKNPFFLENPGKCRNIRKHCGKSKTIWIFSDFPKLWKISV